MITNLKPKKFKFKRLHKGKIKKCKYKSSARKTWQGAFGLKILKSSRLTANQIEQIKKKILTIRKKKEKQRI
jgi:ribosomal protein L16/L10AE